MPITNSYVYTIDLSLMLKDEIITLNKSNINSIIINSDYDKNTMPSIIVGISVSPNIYNKFVLNSNKSFISAKIYKTDINTIGAMDSVYIENRFIYRMTDNPNYNESLLAQSTTDENIGNATLSGYIALISLDSINSNKKIFNAIIKNTNLFSMTMNFINHMNLCIEPFDNNPTIEQFIVPPITSITNLLQFINQYYPFYKSGYRYFRDFDITYLLSSSGTAIKLSNDSYNHILINIVDPSSNIGYDNGIEIDNNSKSYIINISANSTSLDKNNYIDNNFNSILGVDSEGNTEKLVLDIPKNPESTEKVYLERVNNLDYIYNIKNILESKTIILTISKANIDSSLITPNKEYIVKNYKSNSDYDGKYLLSYKKEVLILSSNGFVSNIVFGLRKINGDGE